MEIHFIGIGGIGVSALACYYIKKGHKVSGSDLVETEITNDLKKKGAKIIIGKHKTSNLNNSTDLVVYTSATAKDNPELKKAKKYKIKSRSYPQALGEITRNYFTICVSGTHGKSTTSSMASILLMEAGFDPTVIIGTKLKQLDNTNCRVGKSDYLVIEADEYKGAFLNYFPNIVILTSLEKEHLDYFKNEENIFKIYKQYLERIPEDGVLIANYDDENVQKLIETIKNPKFEIKNYSFGQKNESKTLARVLQVPGDHNVQNALSVLNLGNLLRIRKDKIYDALSKYIGSWRRFELFKVSLNKKNIILVSDYAHHPTEIRATLIAAREKFDGHKIILVFQPHQYQRTKLLFDDFVKSFDFVDRLILNEIYGVAGRERGSNVSGKDLANAIKKRGQIENVDFFVDQKDILKQLKKITKDDDVLIIMGAGDIYNLTLKLTN
jgi:UDP-N-acetylmuramate--alanine ligase